MYLNVIWKKRLRKIRIPQGLLWWLGQSGAARQPQAKGMQKSEYAIDTESKIKLVGSDPVAILVGGNPRMIDERQHVPKLWNVAKTEIKHRENELGQFTFAGSSTPADMS